MSLQAATIFDGRQCYAGGYGTQTTSHDPTKNKNLGGVRSGDPGGHSTGPLRPIHPTSFAPPDPQAKWRGAPSCWK
jgi:hypothetical protein